MDGKEPKIVLFDLETLPNLKEAMRFFPRLGDYPGLTLKASINSIICVGYKIWGEKQVHCLNAWDYHRWKKDVNDDFDLVKAAFEILKDADGVITHNGKRFDWKFLQTRLMVHGLPPLPKIIHIDTCQEAKKSLMLFNNKLDTLAKALTNQSKMESGGWPLWEKVSNRDKKSMGLMSSYCKQDVLTLEAVFKRLRPFIKSLPNLNLFTSGKRPLCPSCGSTRIQRRGYYLTKTSTYHRYVCKDCHSWSRTSAEDRLPRT